MLQVGKKLSPTWTKVSLCSFIILRRKRKHKTKWVRLLAQILHSDSQFLL